MSVRIIVRLPVKKPNWKPKWYEFRCILKSKPASQLVEFNYRLNPVKQRHGSLMRHIIRVGYIAYDFTITHHEIWDSIYPMLLLTRNGGPLFQEHTEAVIRFQCRILAPVADFYEDGVQKSQNLRVSCF